MKGRSVHLIDLENIVGSGHITEAAARHAYRRYTDLGVVESGTGMGARVPGVKIAGKTGTADVENGNFNSFFIGFAPYDHPTLVVSVVIEGNGEKAEATIRFRDVGTKHLALAWAPLKKL